MKLASVITGVVIVGLLILLGFFYVVRVDYDAEQGRMAEALRVRELELTAEGLSKEPNLLQERIEILEKALLTSRQDLQAHKQEAQRVKELLVKQQLIFLELLKRQEARIRALEKANKVGLFCEARRGGQVWQDGR